MTGVSIVSEAMPQARGRVLAMSNAVATTARSIGIVVSGIVYEAYGIVGPVVISVAAGVLSIVLLTIGLRRSYQAPSPTRRRRPPHSDVDEREMNRG